MPRKSIYITEELAAKMARYEQENWSKIAAVCFEQRIADLMQEQSEDEMQTAIQRLRAGKMQTQSKNHRAGVTAGFDWAKSSANYEELDRLVSYEAISQIFEGGPSAAFSAAEQLACIIVGADPTDRETADAFWSRIDDSGKQYDDEFVEGFIDGATRFFDEVSDQLE